MSEEKFVAKNLDNLIEKDADIKKYFADNKFSNDELKNQLEESLKQVYSRYHKYTTNNGRGTFSKYGAKGLRGLGLICDVLGTYLFWNPATTGGGFGLKGLGLGQKYLADLIDAHYYEKQYKNAKDDFTKEYGEENLKKFSGLIKDASKDLKTLAEQTAERIGAYLPLGAGEIIDYARGEEKFKYKINKLIIYAAKQEFLKRIGKYVKSERPGGNAIPLDNYKRAA